MVTSNQLNTLLDELIDLWISSQISTSDFLNLCNSKNSLEAEKSRLYIDICKKISSINLLLGQQQILDDLIQRRPRFVNQCFKIKKNQEFVDTFKAGVDQQLLKRDRQILLKQQLEAERQRQQVRLQDFLDTDFLEASKAIPNHGEYNLLSAEDIEKLKTRYVCDWASHELGLELDDEQAYAITHVNGTTKVTARAGSGKTRILVTRAIFLIKHCKVSPNSILLLAFNRKAVNEMRSRLTGILGNEIPHVMTFHSLAWGIVQPLETMISDDPSKEGKALSHAVQSLINTELHKSSFLDQLRNLMLEYFRTDWNAITEKSFGVKEKEKLDLLRLMRSETLKGDFVKSYGEKLIANTLFDHGITYEYERARRWGSRTYRPDFSIKLESGGGVAIEYFGLTGIADYDQESQKKREYWKLQPGWTLVERFPQDVAGDEPRFVSDLICELEKLGLQPKKLSENEIWQLVKKRSINKFTEVIVTFISRCRKLGLTDEALQLLINDHKHESKAEIEFLKIARPIYKSYLSYLKENKSEDFDGLLGRASNLVSKNHTNFAYKNDRQCNLRLISHLMIDEFQDFSILFYQLIRQIKAISPNATFFCVGDDWQAINGFAGSDLKYFNKFSEYFIDSTTTQVSTNHRSSKAIVSFGNFIMQDHGLPAKPSRDDVGRTLVAYLDEFSSKEFEKYIHKDDKITPILLRIIHKYISQNKEVAILFRTNRIPYPQNSNLKDVSNIYTLPGYKKYLCECLQIPETTKIIVSTSHKYKGLESDVVIIADALVDKYPIIHATEQLLRIFGEDITKIFEDNRRLFYVAATRAKETLVIITESQKPSPFLENNKNSTPLVEIDWREFPTPSSIATDVYLITVCSAYPVKANLIDLGYKFDDITKCWSLQISSKDWSEDSFKKQVWISNVGKIEVKAQNGDLIYVKN